MDKDKLRKEYIEIRKNIDNKEKRNNEIFEKVINSEEYKNNKLILTYVSLNDEVDTFKLIKYSLNNGKEVAVPKCEGNIICFYYIHSIYELEKGNYDIFEPQNCNKVSNFEESICIVPGICFDKLNNRIGYGKGYYDRFLKEYNGTKIGLTYDKCISKIIDTNKFDVKVDKIVMG